MQVLHPFSFSLTHPLFPTSYLTIDFPWLILMAIAFLFLMNACLLTGSKRFFCLQKKASSQAVLSLGLIDVAGYGVAFLFANLSFSISESMSGTPINSADLYTAAGGAGTVCVALLLATSLLYWLYLAAFKKQFTVKQSSRLALVFALVNTPYIYLVPMSWFR
ncbi:MAG: hypothetical protein ABF820_09355 [Sporolactobacillus sp.]